jgi:hypothetical protein
MVIQDLCTTWGSFKFILQLTNYKEVLMAGFTENKQNQSILVLVVALIALGFSEQHELIWLFRFSIALAGIMIVSIGWKTLIDSEGKPARKGK